MSDTAPCNVPGTITDAPITGAPVWSRIFPEIRLETFWTAARLPSPGISARTVPAEPAISRRAGNNIIIRFIEFCQ